MNVYKFLFKFFQSTSPTGDLLFSSSKLKLNTNETIMSKRWISVQKITSNLQLHRNKTTDNIIDKNTLRYLSLNF